MADERDKEQFDDTQGSSSGQQPTGQQGQQGELGQQKDQQTSDIGGQSSTGQAEQGSESETLTTDQSASDPTGQAGASTGEGFIGSQGTGSDDLVEQQRDTTGSASLEEDEDKGSPTGE